MQIPQFQLIAVSILPKIVTRTGMRLGAALHATLIQNVDSVYQLCNVLLEPLPGHRQPYLVRLGRIRTVLVLLFPIVEII